MPIHSIREKFVEIAHFKLMDEPLLLSGWQWFWATTIERWEKEGLTLPTNYTPSCWSSDPYLSYIFGFDRIEMIPIDLGLLPKSKPRILKKSKDYQIISQDGVVRKQFVPKTTAEKITARSMSQWMEFPIKNEADWKMFKKRLNPYFSGRYPEYWEKKKQYYQNRDYPLGVSAGSFYGWIRGWVGMENLSLMFYDNPNLVHEMMEYLEYFIIETIKKAVEEIKFDFAHFWEDMACNAGPLVSPKIFKEFMMPRYKNVTEFLHKHGIDIITVDSDGNIEKLIPLWLESGVNGFLPLEVAAGMDAVALRKEYGKDVILIGNIDKGVLARGKEAIQQEVMSKVPYLLSQGGYFPVIDHGVPPDVSFENYMYYLRLLREISKG